jgi:hypothetical protein
MMNPVVSENLTSAGAVRPATRRLLVAFAVLTFLAVTQLLLLADVADRYWAWTIHTEMTAAFLGAAYAAGFVLAVVSLRQHDWSRIRVPLMTVTAFTWLTAVATVVHLHKLLLVTGGPFARSVAWVWLAVYLVIPLACVAVVARQELRRVGPDVVVRSMPVWLTVLLGAQGLVLFTAGVLLFSSGMNVHHGEPRAAAAFWPWALMPLSAQVIGAWLMALGVAAALAIRQRDLSRLLVSAMTYTTFGVCQFVAVFWHWSQFSQRDRWLWVYLMVLVVIVLTGAYGWWAARRAAGDPVRATEGGQPATATARGRPDGPG